MSLSKIVNLLPKKLRELKKHQVMRFRMVLMSFLLFWQKVEGEFVFVTGADSSHYKTVKQFLRSFFNYEKESKIVFYDLGLSDEESRELKQEFPAVIFKEFDYSQYPDYFNIRENAGGYAWKPVIFWDTLNEYKCKVMWMDAGTYIKASLEKMKKYISMKGYFWNYSPDTIEDWTHEITLSYLNVPEEFYNYRNLASGAVGVDYHHKEALEVAREWKECALHKDCISPDGSDRTNHRQDQAALTILAHKRGLANGLKLRRTGYLVQQDID